jgi:plastocyanin
MKLLFLATLVVKIIADSFHPSTLTVTPGTTVVFVNKDDDAHTVPSTTAGLFDSKGLDTNDSWKKTFTKIGTFTYFCELHPFMKGTIIVKAAKP